MRYYLRMLVRGAKRVGFFVFLWRAISLGVLIIFQSKSRFQVNFGDSPFFFDFEDRGAHRGGRGLFLFRDRIEDLMRFGHQLVKAGDICVDGGANQGVYTLAFLARAGKEGSVIAIEPMEYCINLITESAKSNGFEIPFTVQAALSNKPGTAVLDYSDGVGFGSIVRDFGNNHTVEVETTTIDLIVENMRLKKVDFIKLDIEGAELLALEGATNTMRNLRPTICLECENDRVYEVSKYLENFNYHASVFDLNGNLVKLQIQSAADILPKNTNQVFYIPSGGC
jgi:FkbM family methyltransferase